MNSGICGHEFLKNVCWYRKLTISKTPYRCFGSQAAPYEHMATQKNCYFKTLLL